MDAAQSITVQDLFRDIRMIADSFGERDTPSRGLEATATYIADRFERLGLKPLSAIIPDGIKLNRFSGWFERYPIPLDLDFTGSRVVFLAKTHQAVAGFASAVRIVPNWLLGDLRMPGHPVAAKVFLVAGNHTERSASRAKLQDGIVLYIPSERITDLDQDPILARLASGSQGVVVLSREDSVTFANRMQIHFRQPILRSMDPGWGGIAHQWSVAVRQEAVQGLEEVFRTAGLDLPAVISDTTPVVRELPSLQISLEVQYRAIGADTATAPNVIGVLEGSDPELKDNYVVLMAHMDEGTSHQTDSIAIANDNVRGTAALLALAKAFSQARPRRSIIFVATSGGAKPGFWGSYAFANGLLVFNFDTFFKTIVPIVTSIDLELAGGPVSDAVAVEGIGDMEGKLSPTWISAAHPELQLNSINGGSILKPKSDYFPFIAHPFLLVPSLQVHTVRDSKASSVTDSLTALDAESVMRVARFAFYMGQQVTNADRDLRWTSEARQRLLQKDWASP